MATFKISGVLKNSNGVITHYAFHTVTNTGITKASKKSKADAIEIIDKPENTAKTWIWSYTLSSFVDGQNVEVVGSGSNKYLRSIADNKLSDNLAHLIDYDWIQE